MSCARHIPLLVAALGVVGTLACGDAPSEPAAARDPSGAAETAVAPSDASAAVAASDVEPAPTTAEGPGVDDAPSPAGDTDSAAEPTAPAERPADYGALKPPRPLPDPETLTVFGLAGYEVVAVYSEPNLEADRLGYLRFGQRIMVTPKIDDEGEGCKKGFHALAMGGFACASKGLIVKQDVEPYMYLPPPPPRMEAPLPYDYGTIAKDGTPMWWRMADADEVRLADEKYAATLPSPEPVPSSTKKIGTKTAPAPAGEPTDAPTETGLPSLDDPAAPPPRELTEAEKKELERQKEERRKREEARKEAAAERQAELAKKMANLPLNSSKPFMEKGFIVTLSERVREKGRAWWRTTRGGFVESSRAWRRKTQDFHGAEVPEGSGFPFGFVMSENGGASTMDDKGSLKWKRKLVFREFLDFTAEVDVGGRPYLVTADGLHVPKQDLRLAVPGTRPEELAPWEPWIDVSLEDQILVAYEGNTPVYATLVSTGKKGTAEESFATPKGKWRIRSKHISSSMDGTTASDGNYSIQDVPWTMFFEGSYALHGAFWHSRFGNRRSHGCVNLGPTDARWLFFWATPTLPEGWHGVNAHEGAPGTMIVVH